MPKKSSNDSLNTAAAVKREMKSLATPEQKATNEWFFKTGPGEYSEHDKFIGLKVPVQRKIAKRCKEVKLIEVEKLLQSPIHEHRLTATIILVNQVNRDSTKLDEIYKLYKDNLPHVNNWDIIDGSAPQIVGGYLKSRSRKPLYKWAKSKNLWERRIAILATYNFIKDEDYGDTLEIADILLHDNHDLIHKAVGWMIREVGNRNLQVEESFLKPRYQEMPRTMLRYAIEKFEENKRQAYLKGKV